MRTFPARGPTFASQAKQKEIRSQPSLPAATVSGAIFGAYIRNFKQSRHLCRPQLENMPLDAMSQSRKVEEGLEVMTASAFRFYLPGYLLLSLDAPKRFEPLRVRIFRFLRWALAPYQYHAEGMCPRETKYHEAARDRREERMRLLSPGPSKGGF